MLVGYRRFQLLELLFRRHVGNEGLLKVALRIGSPFGIFGMTEPFPRKRNPRRVEFPRRRWVFPRRLFRKRIRLNDFVPGGLGQSVARIVKRKKPPRLENGAAFAILGGHFPLACIWSRFFLYNHTLLGLERRGTDSVPLPVGQHVQSASALESNNAKKGHKIGSQRSGQCSNSPLPHRKGVFRARWGARDLSKRE